MAETTKPLLDKLGVKAGTRVAVVGIDDGSFMRLLRERTADIVQGKPRQAVDIVFLAANTHRDLRRLKTLKSWIEPNGAIWVVRPKGGRGSVREMDVMGAGLAAGLVDNKIASFSELYAAMRLVVPLARRGKRPRQRLIE